MKKDFWEKFYEKPLNEIPWLNNKADWLEELANEGKITGESALDVGCGVGTKSFFLAQKCGFNHVLGIDISDKAIALAKQFAKENNLDDKCTFIAGGASETLLKLDKKFDFAVDWATMHCIPNEELGKYTSSISASIKNGGKILLRFFSNNGTDESFKTIRDDGLEKEISIMKESDVMNYYKEFKIADRNISTPKRHPNLIFLELLLEK